jgi:hypothetical protein
MAGHGSPRPEDKATHPNRQVHVQQNSDLFSKGGFSTNMRTGKSPTSGYMVSIAGAEKTIPSSMMHPHHLAAFADAHAKALDQSDRAMGGWNDTKRGQIDLDVSVNMPSGGPVKRAEAHGAMITHGQRSLYNIDTDTVESNKYYGMTKPEAHAKIKSQYEEAARGHR